MGVFGSTPPEFEDPRRHRPVASGGGSPEDRVAGPTQAERRVLVVDDEPLVRAFLRDVLERAGCHVREAGDGAEGLELLDVEPLPDLVFVDLRMPVLDGFEFVRTVRRRSAYGLVRIVAISAEPYKRDPVLAAGAEAFLAKPFRISDVLTELA